MVRHFHVRHFQSTPVNVAHTMSFKLIIYLQLLEYNLVKLYCVVARNLNSYMKDFNSRVTMHVTPFAVSRTQWRQICINGIRVFEDSRTPAETRRAETTCAETTPAAHH